MTDSRDGHHYAITSWLEKLVSDYTGLNILEVGKLNYLDYLRYRRDAFIFEMNKTESGQEYLDNAWRMEQTEPDRTRLREKFGRKGG